MGHVYGYAVASMRSQDLAAQLKQLRQAGVKNVFQESLTSIDAERPEFNKLMKSVGAGDIIVVTRIDRLARNTRHFLEITQDLNRRGICLKVLGVQLNTSTENGQMMLSMLRAIAEFERELLLERQKEGIEKAKLAGKFKGRKATARAKSARVLKLLEKGLTRQQVADKLKIGVASVYRILKENREPALPEAKQKVTVQAKSRKKVAKPGTRTRTKPRLQTDIAQAELPGADDQLSLF